MKIRKTTMIIGEPDDTFEEIQKRMSNFAHSHQQIVYGIYNGDLYEYNMWKSESYIKPVITGGEYRV